MHRHRNLGGRSSPATAVSPRTLASFERRSESVSQCTGSFSLSSSRTGAPECPITRVILVCNKPAPRCQGGGDHPRRITSRRWSHLRTHMLLMEYHLCFIPPSPRTCTRLSLHLRLTCFNPSDTLFQRLCLYTYTYNPAMIVAAKTPPRPLPIYPSFSLPSLLFFFLLYPISLSF